MIKPTKEQLRRGGNAIDEIIKVMADPHMVDTPEYNALKKEIVTRVISATNSGSVRSLMLDALYIALPFVEDALEDDTYKKTNVSRQVQLINHAIKIAEQEGK